MNNKNAILGKRLSVRLNGPLAVHVERQVTNHLYESDSEYIGDLVRRDMIGMEEDNLRDGIIQGYADIALGRFSNKTNDELFEQALQELITEGHQVQESTDTTSNK